MHSSDLTIEGYPSNHRYSVIVPDIHPTFEDSVMLSDVDPVLGTV